MLRLLTVNTLVEVKGMRTDYKVLGDYIQLVDQRNRDLSVTNLLGVSIEKRFIPSIANIVGTDLSSYKIVRTGQFAYGPVTSRNGEKISIAYLDSEDCIISSSYTVFEVTKKDQLDSEYLMLWFSRPEFDRYARYKSHGSVREIFDWNELCAVELPVPAIEEQRNIVKAYKAITDRIALKKQINDNLAA
jgi:type I restriction enzyme S subunit